MVSIARYRNYLSIVLMGFILLITLSCDKKERYTGIYLPEGKESPEQSETYIELKENGQGIWRIHDDEVSMRWTIKDNEIWLHTKAGGIVIGKIKDDAVEITLPGRSITYFKKSR
jgi:hypothetical protein